MESPAKPFQRPLPSPGKYLFFSTGTPELLLKGIEVELQLNYTPEQCKAYLKLQLAGKVKNVDQLDLLVYLAGGVPFLSGTLEDMYKNGPNVNSYIYGILMRPASDKILDDSYPELCNAKDSVHRYLLSPLFESSEKGMCDVACLLGYLNHDGVLWDKLLKSCSCVIRFPPFITSLNRIAERNGVTGRDVITVTSTLHTYFSYLLNVNTKSENVFEYALKCCSYIININNDNECFPMKCSEIDDSKSLDFLKKLGQKKICYFWEGDTDSDFVYYSLEKFNPDEYESDENFLSFKPIAPLSIRVAAGCSIVKGRNQNFLYISQSPEKGASNLNLVNLIDPIKGMAYSVDIEKFAIEQGSENDNSIAGLIDTSRVKQVYFVCFDQSGSMKKPLGGDKEELTNETQTRAIIATQYLTSFANKTYGYRIPCIQGLIRFNNKISINCPLSPLIPDFEEKGLKNLQPTKKTYLWDAISIACDELVKFTTTSNGNKRFKKAVNRILVISDGEDTGSKISLLDVTKKIIENKIHVDSVIVNSKDTCKQLAALCHISGGLAFRPNSTNEGLLLFEKSAFLNYDERTESYFTIKNDKKTIRQKNIKPEHINDEILSKVIENTEFDKIDDIGNKILKRAQGESRLASPRHICSINKNSNIQQPRRRRILRELHFCAIVMEKKSDRYDENVKVYPFASSFDVWQVFLKGEEKTPYEGKWFYLLVTFPELYPIEAPIFRFISVPYHLNISSEGRICLYTLEKGYMPSNHVIDIIQQIKELFVIPSLESPVQIEILETYMQDKNEYYNLAKQSALEKGKDDFEEFLPARHNIDDSIQDGFEVTFSKSSAPAYMISQISGRVIREPYLASSGVYYEKEELKQLVTNNLNPICYITSRRLTETPDDFI